MFCHSFTARLTKRSNKTHIYIEINCFSSVRDDCLLVPQLFAFLRPLTLVNYSLSFLFIKIAEFRWNFYLQENAARFIMKLIGEGLEKDRRFLGKLSHSSITHQSCSLCAQIYYWKTKVDRWHRQRRKEKLWANIKNVS